MGLTSTVTAFFDPYSALDLVIMGLATLVFVLFVGRLIGQPHEEQYRAKHQTKHNQMERKRSMSTGDASLADQTQLRYFTKSELNEFNGTMDSEIYIALKGKVYDVSEKRDFYGPNGGYHLFAGKDATRALAKMSFEDADLENDRYDDLSFMEIETLNDWIAKFEVFNAYPIRGRVVAQDLEFHPSSDDLAKFNGVSNLAIYVVVKDIVYDVTLKGADMYGPKGSYAQFAGRDITTALATMSLDMKMIEEPIPLCDLTPTQAKTLEEWVVKFDNKYPRVGKVVR